MTNPRRTRHEAAEPAERRIEQAQARIETAVSQIQSGRDWQAYLGWQFRLHAVLVQPPMSVAEPNQKPARMQHTATAFLSSIFVAW